MFLFSLEVLSVLGATEGVIHALNTSKEWLKKVRSVSPSDVITKSSTHIFHSAPALGPRMFTIVRPCDRVLRAVLAGGGEESG